MSYDNDFILWQNPLNCLKSHKNKKSHESYLDLVNFFFVDIWEGQLTKKKASHWLRS